MRRIVYPGDKLSDKEITSRGIYTENGKSYAALIGFYDDDKQFFIPLEGVYEPSVGDLLIGLVADVKPNGYVIEVGLPSDTFMSSRDFRESLGVGDIIVAKVKSVSETRNISLADPAVLKGGNIIKVSPVKIPRIIGKKGSMLTQVKDATASRIIVGKNGWIWIKGGNEYLATKAILKIEKEAHTSGLTDKIGEFLRENVSNNENKI